MVRILIVSGIRLYREGLVHLISLNGDTQLEIVGVIGAAPTEQADLDRLKPDVVLLDIATTGSYAVVRHLKSTLMAPVVALGVEDSDEEVLACTEAGAVGYVTRDASLDELIAVVRSAARGEMVCSPRVAGKLARRLASLAGQAVPARIHARLSRREREIVALIGEDLSNKEIAQRLNIEVATVKNHVHNLLEKLHVRRRSEAASVVRILAQSQVNPEPRGHLV